MGTGAGPLHHSLQLRESLIPHNCVRHAGNEEKKVHALGDHSRKEVKKKKKNAIKGLIRRQTIYWPQIRGRRLRRMTDTSRGVM